MIDHNRQFIFVHIPKTAGLSIYRLLGNRHEQGHKCRLDYVEDYFSFTVVRNPWDRLVSAYSYLSNGGRGNKGDLHAQLVLSRYHDFTTVVRHIDEVQADFAQFNPTGNGIHIRGIPHLLPQHSWTHVGHRQIIDYLCRFEQLEHDLHNIRRVLHLRNVSLPHFNMSARSDFRTMYTDETAEIVRRHYGCDVALFGYEF